MILKINILEIKMKSKHRLNQYYALFLCWCSNWWIETRVSKWYALGIHVQFLGDWLMFFFWKFQLPWQCFCFLPCIAYSQQVKFFSHLRFIGGIFPAPGEIDFVLEVYRSLAERAKQTLHELYLSTMTSWCSSSPLLCGLGMATSLLFSVATLLFLALVGSLWHLEFDLL